MSSVSPKVIAGTLAAAIVTIIVWAASAAGISVPVEVQGAVTTILVFAAGYLKLDPKRAS
jgi:ABC-type enterobactin transport system permease subunit